MKKIINLFIVMLFGLVSNAQSTGYEFKVKLSNKLIDTIILAYYLGGKTYVKDTGVANNSTVIFKGNEKLEKGMYLFVCQKNKEFVEFLVDDNQQRISFELDFENPNKRKVFGSQASADLIAYLIFLESKRQENDALSKQLKEAGANEAKKKNIQQKTDSIEEAVKKYQNEYIRKNPTALLSLIIKINLPYEPPVFSGSEEEKENKNYQWYKAHWFDNTSMSDPRMIRTNQLKQKVDYYVDKLTVQHPDSIIQSVDEVINRVKQAPDTYKFFLIEFLNKYSNSRIMGMDAVYVHVAMKYYATGKTPWVDAMNLNKILEAARRMEPLLIGKKTPDIEVKTIRGEKIRLWDFDAAYTILFFWDFDISYCSKSAITLLEIEKKFREKGVKVFSVCTNTGNGVEAGFEKFVLQNKMQPFVNTFDIDGISKNKYKIYSHPAIYILDKNKVIQVKDIDKDQVEEWLKYLLGKKESLN